MDNFTPPVWITFLDKIYYTGAIAGDERLSTVPSCRIFHFYSIQKIFVPLVTFSHVIAGDERLSTIPGCGNAHLHRHNHNDSLADHGSILQTDKRTGGLRKLSRFTVTLFFISFMKWCILHVRIIYVTTLPLFL